MATLRLFGGASIEGETGPVTGAAAQRHRLALLALLSTAHSRALSRDKLIGYLWPESDVRHGRNLLNQGVHALRRALGTKSIVSAGDELRLDPGALWVDVVQFQEALESGDLEGAVEVHRGPFLDGFFLPAAVEFERWLDAERSRLRRAYQTALGGLAEAAAEAGDPAGAVHWWWRLAAEDPYSTRVALELMQALEAAGERAEAIRHARVHALLLDEEFGAEPDPAVVALAERMRTEPEAELEIVQRTASDGGPTIGKPDGRAPIGQELEDREGTGRAAARGLEAERDPGIPSGRMVLLVLAGIIFVGSAGYLWDRGTNPSGDGALPSSVPTLSALDEPSRPSVAVLAFDDLSPEGDHAWFADGVAEEILSALSRVEGLDVSARQSSFAFRGRPIDVRQIGDELGVAAVLEGSVRKGGDSVWVTAQLIDAANGFQLWSETYARVPTAENLRAIQVEVAREVAATLELQFRGDREARPAPPYNDAYDRYLEGRSLLRRVQTDDAGGPLRDSEALLRSIGLFREAVARSPDWADGWAALGEALYWAGCCYIEPHVHYPESRAALERAIALDPGHAQAHASLAFVLWTWDHDLEAAEARYLHALTLGGSDGWAGYGMLLNATRRHDEAITAFRNAEAHDPLSFRVKNQLLMNHVCAGRYDDAIAYAERGLRLGGGIWPYWSLALALERSGRGDEGLARIDEAAEKFELGPGWVVGRALLHARVGRVDEARALIRGFEEGAPQDTPSPQIHAAALLAVGEPDDPITLLDRLIDPAAPYILLDCRLPELQVLREDPRYPEIVRRHGFPLW